MKLYKKFLSLKTDLLVGRFLAVRELKRNNPWSTALIIFVMSLTFLNMILMGGVLIGLAEGMMNSFKTYYSSDIIIKPAPNNPSITETNLLNNVISSLPTYRAASNRYTTTVTLENKDRIKVKVTEIGERVGATLVGINPEEEDLVTGLSQKIIAGSFLGDYDINGVILGKSLLSEYSKGSSTEPRLNNITIGSRLNLIIGNSSSEVVVRGILDSGNTTVDGRIFALETTMRSWLGNQSMNANEVSVLLQPNSSSIDAKNYILSNYAFPLDVRVETAEEALPKAISDMKKTFSMLGNIVGLISLVVGSITIFIVIFVNAITRRKYIGILKGIGISVRAIEISYILQSLFYALSGIVLASFIVLWFLKPWFDIHPVKFPVTEGSLSITTGGLIIRGLILSFTAFVSGFIPAYLITKQNTLDAILGR